MAAICEPWVNICWLMNEFSPNKECKLGCSYECVAQHNCNLAVKPKGLFLKNSLLFTTVAFMRSLGQAALLAYLLAVLIKGPRNWCNVINWADDKHSKKHDDSFLAHIDFVQHGHIVPAMSLWMYQIFKVALVLGSGTEKQKTFLECHFNHVIEHYYVPGIKDDSSSFCWVLGNWGLQADEGVVWII